MDLASAYYLGTTLLMLAVFAAIVARTYSRKEKTRGEEAKYRMMGDEYPTPKPAKEDTHVR
jgi:cbb3-type cytochrome oxidase subunit 3